MGQVVTVLFGCGSSKVVADIKAREEAAREVAANEQEKAEAIRIDNCRLESLLREKAAAISLAQQGRDYLEKVMIQKDLQEKLERARL